MTTNDTANAATICVIGVVDPETDDEFVALNDEDLVAILTEK